MSNDYDKFLCRMVEYREKLHLTQKDVGNFLGKDQSQFSKMELGKTVVSYEILESLRGTGWDIDYIITGKEKINVMNNLSTYLKGKMGEEWKNLNEVSGIATREQWAIFDAACNKAYEPVLVHARAKADEKKKNKLIIKD